MLSVMIVACTLVKTAVCDFPRLQDVEKDSKRAPDNSLLRHFFPNFCELWKISE